MLTCKGKVDLPKIECFGRTRNIQYPRPYLIPSQTLIYIFILTLVLSDIN